MSIPSHALAARIPAALHDDANRLAWALGYQDEAGNTFSIPLSDGSSAMVQWVTPSFLVLLSSPLPAGVPWADYGLTEERAQAVLDALDVIAVLSAGAESLPVHFSSAMYAWGVQL